ncbi:MAG: DUF6236 family protein [Syntrophobacterales bacterium]|jgi:hypothetical protein|nr:DUF6236 family protein [Syntrophobacterales bacterium]
MAFSKALYYPWIEIQDESWLKNAMLYWDKIQTIVPRSIKQPYKNRIAEELFNEGLLIPFYVHPDLEEIEELTEDVLQYINSPEGTQVIFSGDTLDYQIIHPDKFSERIFDVISMHPEKLPYEIQHMLERSLDNESQWFSVNKRFANFYMTLLATHLSERHGIALLTDSASNSRLANVARLDGNLSLHSMGYGIDYRERPRRRRGPSARDLRGNRSLAQAMLADLILEGIQIDPETPVNKIIIFRERFQSELGRFRTKISELANEISIDQPLEAIRQNINDKYINDVKPAIESMKTGLKENMIRFATDTFLKVFVVSTTATSVLPALIGLSIPCALLAGASVSFTANTVLYNIDKAQKLRENPFTYLLKAQKEFDPQRYQVTVTPL